MYHLLYLEDVATADISGGDDHDLDEFLDWVLNHADGLESGLTLVLLSHE